MSDNKPFSVLYWGSHPDLDNDDCWTGEDFDTLEEAMACFLADPPDHTLRDTQYIELDGHVDAKGNNLIRLNPHFRSSRKDDFADWKQEAAHQAGMAFGPDGYNDEMGW
jgi:hypothetical protein